MHRAVRARHHGLPTGWLAAVGWLLTLARRRLDWQVRFGPVLGRGAYAAFTLYGPVLIGLAVALRTMWVPAQIKAVVVADLAIAALLALAGPLIKRALVLAHPQAAS